MSMASTRDDVSFVVEAACANMGNERNVASLAMAPHSVNMVDRSSIAVNVVEPECASTDVKGDHVASAKEPGSVHMGRLSKIVLSAKTSYVKCAMARNSATEEVSSST